MIPVAKLSPRSYALLEYLLRSNEPVKIDVLTNALNTSRRTIFRELENIGNILAASNTELVSVPGKGIAFSGRGETRQRLLEELAEYAPSPQATSKRIRQLRLLIELIANAGETQKMFCYAKILETSESTVSRDLDELDAWLVGRGVVITRKAGLGVQCEGAEENLRATLVSRFMLEEDFDDYSLVFDFPGEDIETGVREILCKKAAVVDWMTSESLRLITTYLLVMVERVHNGNTITVASASTRYFQTAVAEELSEEIAKEFALVLPETERQALAVWIQSCRSKQDSPPEPILEGKQSLMQRITLKMIDRFDPSIAAVLKTNDQLIRLLSRHLESAVPRLKDGIYLPNPLEEELIKNYPEVYEKTCRSVEVLEEVFGIPIPSNEVSYIQIHFLAALAVLGERNTRRRILRAGIVCVSGIGTSYMLAYQIDKRFKGELKVEVSDCDDCISWSNMDFLISTIPLEGTEKPVILVQTILGEKDFQKIQEAVTAFAFTERKAEQGEHPHSLEKRLDNMIEIFMQSRKLLDNFAVESIRADCSFDELVRFAANRFAQENPSAVCRALIAREAIASQVVGELGIVLLHTRSAYHTSPLFAVIVPEGKFFTDAYFKQTESCVFMLLPENAPREMTDLMGGVSSALIDLPPFLEAVRIGNKETIQAVLEKEISEIIAHCGI
ncbi:MAG: BglG family transcription antiterminator [Treponema sp.]|jgi:transcriptional antiterminator/mannitol/fructose-specific phosphotransferase system IIA component (Ntr-type)|nr:BglG family transcription antiterminator [Treponema sp.]